MTGHWARQFAMIFHKNCESVEFCTTKHPYSKRPAAPLGRVIAGLLFMGGLRRSEAAALEWRDVTDARKEGCLLVAVRRSKTNPDGEAADVRFVEGDVARAAGIEPRLTAHSGRVELATELTTRGASVHDVMRAGNWKTVRMVAHYSAGASSTPATRTPGRAHRAPGRSAPPRHREAAARVVACSVTGGSARVVRPDQPPRHAAVRWRAARAASCTQNPAVHAPSGMVRS